MYGVKYFVSKNNRNFVSLFLRYRCRDRDERREKGSHPCEPPLCRAEKPRPTGRRP